MGIEHMAQHKYTGKSGALTGITARIQGSDPVRASRTGRDESPTGVAVGQ